MAKGSVEDRLIGLADHVIESAKKKKDPEFQIPVRALSNVEFNEKKRLIMMKDATTGRSFFNLRMARKFTQTMLVGDALAMFGVLPNRHIHAVLVEHRRRIDLAGAFSSGIFELLSLRRIAIVLPHRLEIAGVSFFNRLGIERITKAIAAAEKDQFLPVYFR